jgi:hypothetical protein
MKKHTVNEGLSRRKALALGGLAAWGLAPISRGQTAAPLAAQVLASAATIDALRAPAWIERGGKRSPLAAGSAIQAGETVVTGDNARLVLRMREGSSVTLGQLSSLVIERYEERASAPGGYLNAALSLTRGTLRYVTGALAKFNQRDVSVRTATATIGIRGTRFWAQNNEEHEVVCLFEGAVDIARQGEPLAVLDQPNAFWRAPRGKPAGAVAIANPEQLRGFGGQVNLPEASGIAKADGKFSAFSNIWTESRAQRLAATLGDAGYAAIVAPCASGALSYFDVIVDKLASEADANALLPRLNDLTGRRFEVRTS